MFDWLRKRLKKKKPEAEGAPAGALPEPDFDALYKEAQQLREEKARAEEEVRQEKAARVAKAQKEAEEEYAGRRPPRQKTAEEILEQLPPSERKKYQDRIKAGKRAQVEAELEIWESGIPGRKKVMHRVWNPTQQTWEFKEVEVALTPQERLAEARIQRLGGALIEEEMAGLKQRRRERSFSGRLEKEAIRGASGFGQFMVGTAMLGTAGAAQSIQPGREGPRRAVRMHSPSVPIEAYRVGVTSINLSGLRGGIQPKLRLGGLEHLRGLTLPKRKQSGG